MGFWDYLDYRNKPNKAQFVCTNCDFVTYSDKILALFEDANIEMGDSIVIATKDRIYRGILMPHHKFSKDEIITLKLDSGYNIGILVEEDISVKLREKGQKIPKKAAVSSGVAKKPTISILGTGGTIASYVDYRTGAVHPALSADDLARSVPELTQLCNIRAKVLFSKFSEDMQVENWKLLAKEIAKEFQKGAKGVIIPHGTDTLGYTSAALSFMLENLPGPVILVGAQRSSDRPSTDANLNLISAAKVAISSDLGEVVVMMHKSTSDSKISIHRGTRVRKMHTSRRDAFQNINEPPLGWVLGDEIYLNEPYEKRKEGNISLDDNMNENVAIIYSHPGISPEHFEFLAKQYMGLVIVGTGLGHTSKDLFSSIKRAIESNTAVVMTSQCLYGRVNMNVYSSGRDLLLAGVISGEDMLPETAFVKLMWVLGNTNEPEKVKELMLTNLRGEIGLRREVW